MQLSEFVSESLTQIVQAIVDANERCAPLGAIISPGISGDAELAVQHGFLKTHYGAAQTVVFDVALTATEGTGTKGGIGIVLGAVTLGSAGQSNQENSSVSRVKFCVPVRLPMNKAPSVS